MKVFVKNYNKTMTSVVNVTTSETAFISPSEQVWIDEGFLTTPTPGIKIIKREAAVEKKQEEPVKPVVEPTKPVQPVAEPRSATPIQTPSVAPKTNTGSNGL